ncbi:MAG: tRNA guanosine(34) transglycosylase Tgt [Oscillospiraceae bacterium]|jgi:queuine tRNA-ribosyltransferase|nr:tRNA guanosine(34) transglycosylase Tgt [Oscillospiraceae bacterium]
MVKSLSLHHGIVPLPSFFPDGTYGVVRCVDFDDLHSCHVPGLVMNGFHLLSKPGVNVIKHFKGIHNFSGWNGPILTDSGGFQVFSLIRENPKFGEVRKNKLIFRPDGGSEKTILTPEKSIQFQFSCGSDVMMCLDYCTHPEDSYEITKLAVEITIDWGRRCKEEYEKQLLARKIPYEKRPLIFAIIQGGGYRDLRKLCADELIKIGFDGFGFGGWPVSSDGNLIEDILEYTASLMPDDKIKYAMGLGKPDGIVKCVKMGYNLFDCVIPTREARHNRLYVFDDEVSGDTSAIGDRLATADTSAIGDRLSTADTSAIGDPLAYSHYYILDDKHMKDKSPVSANCDCPMCKKYSRAYLYHLYKVGDSLAYRLATMHNLRFYTRLMEIIRETGARHDKG